MKPARLPVVRRMVGKHHRRLIKTVSWLTLAALRPLIISILITGKLKWPLTISCVELVTKIGLGCVHERVWETFRLAASRSRPRTRPALYMTD